MKVTTNKKLNLSFIYIGLILCAASTFLTHGHKTLASSLLLIIGTITCYYGIKSILKHPINTITVLVSFVLVTSFTSSFCQIITTTLLLILSVILCVINRIKIKTFLQSDYDKIKSLSLTDSLIWIFLFLSLIPLLLETEEGFFAYDRFHPVYELSVGNSYGLSILTPPDLSYVPKTIKYHFLSTRVPWFFHNILPLSIFNSLFFITPLFFLLISFLVINKLFLAYPKIKIPVFILFYMPLLTWALRDEGLIRRTVFSTPSYFTAFALITIAIYYLTNKKIIPLIISAVILLPVRADFFVVLVGGILLFFIRNKDFKKLFISLSILVPVFLIFFKLFLSGAHQHNHWIAFPSILYYRMESPDFESWFSIILPIILLFSTLYVYWKCKDIAILTSLSSISLAGMIGAFCLTELSEGNDTHFLIAAFFSTGIVFWYWLKYHFLQNKLQLLKKGLFCVLIYFVAVNFCSINEDIWEFLFDSFKLKSSIGQNLLQDSLLELKPDKEGQKLSPHFSRDFVDAYDWLRNNVPQQGVVFFGKHYELINYKLKNDSITIKIKGFARSALSAKQMYCEDYKYKGISMNEDYPLRLANSIYFYKTFVNSSPQSQSSLVPFFHNDFGRSPAQPLSTIEDPFKKFLVYHLGFAKKWSWLNRPEQINFETRKHLDSLSSDNAAKNQEWAYDFLKTEGIEYIILENNDSPTHFLSDITSEVYRNPSIAILKMKDTLLDKNEAR